MKCLPKINVKTSYITQSEVNKNVKYRKRISTELIQINRIYHEIVLCDSEEEFEEGSRGRVVRKGSCNAIGSVLVRETTKPIGTVTLGRESNHEEDCHVSSLSRRPSLDGRIPKRWQ